VSESATASYQSIKQNIAGRSKTEIHAWVTGWEGGVDGLLDLIFAELPGGFLPEKAKDQEIDFQFEFDTPAGRRSYFASVRNRTCRCGRGAIASPTVTMTMDIASFLQVLTGEMLPVRAFLTRKIKVSGDMMAATKFESWFQRPDEQ
jgi:putative sterol carrier protein